MAKILIIDDERAIRNTLKEILEFEGYTIDLAENGKQGVEKAKTGGYDLIYSDVKMPEMDGIEVLETLQKEEACECPIVMISGHADVETAVTALKKGAYDFIEKPLDLNRLLVTTKNALEQKSLKAENSRSKEEISVLRKKVGKRNQMIGESEAIQRVRAIIEKVAPTEARVMITGDNGTGKEVVARLLHEGSPRANKPMVEVNCAAIPSELIESELFGHMKGAFTGAVKDRAGKFEQADGGTLFLDEIGDMPLSMQAKLLRVLQEKEIEKIGGYKTIPVDIRILAATRKNLEEMIEKGEFREDLYYRLNVINIEMPPLRKRKDDIPELALHFLDKLNREYKTNITLSNEVLECFGRYSWPGNIRELDNVIKSAYASCDSFHIRLIDLPSKMVAAKKVTESGEEDAKKLAGLMDEYEKNVITEELRRCNWN